MVVDQYRQRYGEDRDRHKHFSSVRFGEGVLDPESQKVLGMIARPEAEQIHAAACRKAEQRQSSVISPAAMPSLLHVESGNCLG
jgi:hypothetical protein